MSVARLHMVHTVWIKWTLENNLCQGAKSRAAKGG